VGRKNKKKREENNVGWRCQNVNIRGQDTHTALLCKAWDNIIIEDKW